MVSYYLAPKVWQVDDARTGWINPVGAVGAIDMRTRTQRAKVGPDPDGLAFIVMPDLTPAPADSFLIGTSPSDTLTGQSKRTMASMLGLPSNTDLDGARNLIEVINRLLSVLSDVQGIGAVRPLIPGANLQTEVILGNNERIYTEQSREGLTVHNNGVAVYQHDYSQLKGLGVPLDFLQKYTGAQMLKYYGVIDEATADKLMSQNDRGDGFKNPATSVSDNFNRADEDLETSADWDLEAGGAGEMAIVSNVVHRTTTGTSFTKYTHATDMSGTDHESQVEAYLAAHAGGNKGQSGVGTRWQDANNQYIAGLFEGPSTSDVMNELIEIVGGSFNQLAISSALTYTAGTHATFKQTSNGSTISSTYDPGGANEDVQSVTDTSLTTGVSLCMFGYTTQASGAARWDDFSGTDLAGGITQVVNDQNVEVSEATIPFRAMNRFVAETIETAEQVSAQLDMYRAVAENEEISEATLFALGITRLQADQLDLTEQVVSALGRVRNIAETEEISEVVSSVIGRVRAAAEQVDITESITVALGIVRVVNEAIDIVEGTVRSRVMVRPLGETLEVAEQTIRALTFVKMVAEQIDISEATVDTAPSTIAAIRDLTAPTRSLDLTAAIRPGLGAGATFPITFPSALANDFRFNLPVAP